MKSCIFIVIVVLTLFNCTKMKVTDKEVNPEKLVVLPHDTTHLRAVSESVQSMYTVFVANRLTDTKRFYTQWFGYTVVFESTWFLLLESPGASQAMLAFISEEHPSSPPTPKVFTGDGAFLTIEVTDAGKLYNAFSNAGADFTYQLKDEPWGQRRFAIGDPNGLWIDVVQQTAPDAGWWDQYIRSDE